MTEYFVIPAKAGIQYSQTIRLCQDGSRIKSGMTLYIWHDTIASLVTLKHHLP